MSFPIFVGTFALGRPIAGLLFGDRYEPSGTYLSILAFGYLVNAASGFNGVTLAANGHTRTVAIVVLAAALIGAGLALVLIPFAGALGAAIAASLTLIIQNVMLQIALWRMVGIPLVDPEALRVFGIEAAATLVLVAIQAVVPFGWWTIVAAGAVSLAVLYLCRDALRVDELFPRSARSSVA